jgi:hypothetical protein
MSDSEDDFIVNDEGVEVLESQEYQDIIAELRRPKLHLNPYPTYDVSQQTKPSVPPKNITEKERIKWLIENKLSPDMTLDEYVKFLEDEEEEIVKAYIQKNKD